MKVTKKRIKRVKQQAITQSGEEEQVRRQANMEEGAAKKVVQSLRVFKNRPLARFRKRVVGTRGSQYRKASPHQRGAGFDSGWRAAGPQITKITGEEPRTSDTPPKKTSDTTPKNSESSSVN